MRAVYWDRDEFDCTEASRSLMHPSAVHRHCETDEEAIEAFLWARECFLRRGFANVDPSWDFCPPTLLGPPFGLRYICITGPGGLLRGVEP